MVGRESKVHLVCQKQLIGNRCLMWYADNYEASFVPWRRPFENRAARSIQEEC
jgi:hypothetical protein